MSDLDPERIRLAEADDREKHWRRWGAYLAERAWGTVREDYSADSDPWRYFTHDEARSRAYRWTEDGLLGICDNHQRLCFALALWNGKDPILKERLFGLSGPQGNHGEDVKELYYYLDATPTNSYLLGLYKYPQAAFPYDQLVRENAARNRSQPEFEIEDTGVFADDKYFDVFVEYAKAGINEIHIRIRILNRGKENAPFWLVPTLWFRNTWSWGDSESEPVPQLAAASEQCIEAKHHTLGTYFLNASEKPERMLFTDNVSNARKLWGSGWGKCCAKDAFHDYIVDGDLTAISESNTGTKACLVYRGELRGGEERAFEFVLADQRRAFSADVIEQRKKEADLFYAPFEQNFDADDRSIQRQASAGLFWSKQFYHYVVDSWLKGDPKEPPPPESRQFGRNSKWRHLFNEDIVSMPDKWEYPWYAAWDLAFHCVAIAPADPGFSKGQLALFLREWYMHPNGQIPAYEWSFGDANPPVHAWACWRVFKIDEKTSGKPDFAFLERVFHKLLVNFTWWVNRKDSQGDNVFEGGFLGLDNIGIFNRSEPLPEGWVLEQSDGSSWMAMFCLNMLKMALRLAEEDKTYEDIASKFFEHFLYIAYAIHQTGSLWDDQDGFYYDRLRMSAGYGELLRVRSMVGLIPLFASDTLPADFEKKFPGFSKRMQWFIQNRPDLTGGLASLTASGVAQRRLLSVVNRERLERILQRVFDEAEFLSAYGVRSLSRAHLEHPYSTNLRGNTFSINYEPGESQTGLFGGNSNWRGPVWFPVNFLLIEALQRFDYYYGDSFKVELPRGSGNFVRLGEAAGELSHRLTALFRPVNGKRPVYGNKEMFQSDPNFRDYILFYEYFHGDTGLGLGASHQTGWTGLVAKLLHQSGPG